nr:zinc finger, CCHC-type [Tanacetum cinerariifolium]
MIKRFRTDRGDFGGSMVPKEVAEEEDVQQPERELRKSKRNKTSKNFGPEFQLYIIERTKNEVSDQHSYCFNVEDDPKTFDETMKSHDIIHHMDVKTAFLNGELDENVYMNQSHGFIMPRNENKVDQTKEFLLSMFSMKDMWEPDVILCIRIKHKSNRIAISQSRYIEKVTEHPDSDSGKRKFMSLMILNELLISEAECNSRLNDIHQSDGFNLVLPGE